MWLNSDRRAPKLRFLRQTDAWSNLVLLISLPFLARTYLAPSHIILFHYDTLSVILIIISCFCKSLTKMKHLTAALYQRNSEGRFQIEPE